MTPIGIGPRDVLSLVRDTQAAGSAQGALLVTGILADGLSRQLAAGGDPSLVRTAGDPSDAAALVRVVAGAASGEDERVLRTATRALVPVVVLQLGDPAARLPYVLATDVVEALPGQGFPMDELATALAAALGPRGPALARGLPVLRPAVERRRAADGALAAAAFAMATGGPRLPGLALAQARMLSDLGVASGAAAPGAPRAAAEAVAPPLGAALGAGLLARALVRRLPFRNRLVDGAVAAATTYALAATYRRIAAAL
jgi:hypothetical protein